MTEDNTTNDVNVKKPSGCLKGVLIYLFICILAVIGIVLVPEEETETPAYKNEVAKETPNPAPENKQVENNINNSKPGAVTGEYSGFGSWAVATANLGGQAANCLEKGVGISLVEQIENFFENISENNRPEFYHIKKNNPRLKFWVSNPVWAENMTFPDACKADVEFENISSDTVMGYSNGKPYTVDNSYCRITYTVSEQGGKFRANVINMFCTPNYGYR